MALPGSSQGLVGPLAFSVRLPRNENLGRNELIKGNSCYGSDIRFDRIRGFQHPGERRRVERGCRWLRCWFFGWAPRFVLILCPALFRLLTLQLF